MDEIRVNSKLMRRFVASFIEKAIKKKFGFDPTLKFNDAIKITYDEDGGVYLHLNMDVMLPKDQFESLLEG